MELENTWKPPALVRSLQPELYSGSFHVSSSSIVAKVEGVLHLIPVMSWLLV